MTREEKVTDLIQMYSYFGQFSNEQSKRHCESLQSAISALESQHEWIPFKDREMTEEEREIYPEGCRLLDGPIPDDGQRILITVKYKGHESVQYDEFYLDGNGVGLDSGYDLITEAIAWQNLPEPYEEVEQDG